MNYYFDKYSWPVMTKPYRPVPRTPQEKETLVNQLQDAKTNFYLEILQSTATAREGVLELIDEAIASPRFKVSVFRLCQAYSPCCPSVNQ
jgi:hypothetical protein